jgi:hypothetical protein
MTQIYSYIVEKTRHLYYKQQAVTALLLRAKCVLSRIFFLACREPIVPFEHPRTARSLFPTGLFNHYQGLRLTFSEICTRKCTCETRYEMLPIWSRDICWNLNFRDQYHWREVSRKCLMSKAVRLCHKLPSRVGEVEEMRQFIGVCYLDSCVSWIEPVMRGSMNRLRWNIHARHNDLEKLPTKQFPTIYETQSFIAVLTRALHWTLT